MRDQRKLAKQAEEEKERRERERVERLYSARENFRDSNRKRQEDKEASEKRNKERKRMELLRRKQELKEGRKKYIYMLIVAGAAIAGLIFLMNLTDKM